MSPLAAELTPQEYLALERQAETRSDYLTGQRYAKSGCSREHVLISGNILFALQNQLLEKTHEVYGSMMRVRTPSGLFAYPDGAVTCPGPQFEDSEEDTLLNPILILEVLSKSTEVYDRTKLEHYRTMPSLAEALLVAQDRPRIEHWVRGDSRWILEDVQDLDATVELPSIGCTLPLKTVYERALGSLIPST
jgi:Uma2 family endonuclease